MVDMLKKRMWSDGLVTNHQQTLTFYQNSRMILKEM